MLLNRRPGTWNPAGSNRWICRCHGLAGRRCGLCTPRPRTAGRPVSIQQLRYDTIDALAAIVRSYEACSSHSTRAAQHRYLSPTPARHARPRFQQTCLSRCVASSRRSASTSGLSVLSRGPRRRRVPGARQESGAGRQTSPGECCVGLRRQQFSLSAQDIGSLGAHADDDLLKLFEQRLSIGRRRDSRQLLRMSACFSSSADWLVAFAISLLIRRWLPAL